MAIVPVNRQSQEKSGARCKQREPPGLRRRPALGCPRVAYALQGGHGLRSSFGETAGGLNVLDGERNKNPITRRQG